VTAGCIADFQSAGAPIVERSSDWKSATQQIGNLRYDVAAARPCRKIVAARANSPVATTIQRFNDLTI